MIRSKAPAGKTWTRSRPSAASRTGPAKTGLPSLAMSCSASIAQQARHADEGPDAGEQLLTRLGRARPQSFGRGGGRQPFVLDRHGVGDDALQEIGAGRGVGPGPRSSVVGNVIDQRLNALTSSGASPAAAAAAGPVPARSLVGATAPRLVMVMSVTLPVAAAHSGPSRARASPRASRSVPSDPAGQPGARSPRARGGTLPGQETRGSTSSERRAMWSRSSRSSTWR